jgi:ADP-ribosyl-[dinitrogen reductase] hydrolase
MLVEMAIGDAYGAGFEYVDPKIVASQNHLRAYLRHPKWKGQPGRYTDDTQMTIGLAELMLRKAPKEWTHYDVARAFVTVFKRDPRTGYAGKFYELLQQMQTGWDFLMRAPVIGLLPDVKQVMEVARFQASLTHCTQLGMEAAVASALMTHYFYYRIGPRKDLPHWLGLRCLHIGFAKVWTGFVGSPGDEHVLAALTAIMENDSLEAVLKACIDFTGDVDTVAAIAMPAASFCDEISQNLPAVLLDNLESGKFGRDYLDMLDDKLMEKFPRPEAEADEPEDDGVWHCTDCGHEVQFLSGEPSEDFIDCPSCGGYQCMSLSGEPVEMLISDLFSS